MTDKYIPDLPNYKVAAKVFLELLEVSKFRPVTPVGRILWEEHARALDQGIRHVYSPQRALEDAQLRVQKELDEIYKKTRPSSCKLGYDMVCCRLCVSDIYFYYCFSFFKMEKEMLADFKSRKRLQEWHFVPRGCWDF